MEDLWQRFVMFWSQGSEGTPVEIGLAVLRAALLYVCMLALIRLSSRRFLGKGSAFDVIVAIMLGSIMSDSVDLSNPFFGTLAAGSAILALHWLFAALAYHTSWFGPLIKGGRRLLVRDGVAQDQALRSASITRRDLEQTLREQLGHADVAKIKTAYLERDGSISIIPRREGPKVIDVDVADGVQTIRIKLE